VLETTLLARLPGVRHGFFTRGGGVSEGPFASLNMGLRGGDEPLRALQNRAIAAARLGVGADRLVIARQVHGTAVIHVRDPWSPAEAPEADGLVTTEPGLALGVLSADCAPLLLAEPEAGMVAAAHAGWRGALAGVIEATVEAMTALGAERRLLMAAVGPCIAQASYEVGDDYRAAFVADDPEAAAFFADNAATGRPHFDLPRYCRARLGRAGVGAVEILGVDTAAAGATFFSHRRASRSGDRRFGLQLSAIALGD
jgi:polyphenol oxidase